jgi:hypothetical protein
MIQTIKILSEFVNTFHDLLIKLSSSLGLTINDKQLHFIVIGIIGLFIFFISDLLFKALAKYSVSIISFIYTFTVLVVIVFAIEIEQKITHRGSIEFTDIAAGLWGFIELFSVYLLIKLILYIYKIIIKKVKRFKQEV